MKKTTLCIILIIGLVMMVGCKREEVVITVEDVKTNTVLVKNDGTVQAAIVEKFDKNYYSIPELNDFISKKMIEYNNESTVGTAVGKEEEVLPVTLSNLEQKDGNAILILNYQNIEHYAAFNKVEAILTSMDSVKNGEVATPDLFMGADDGVNVSKEIALENEKYKVLFINENTDVIVDGTIKYYTNAVLVNSSRIQTASEGQTVVIYKP